MKSFLYNNIDYIGTATSVSLAGISFSDINEIAQAFAAVSAGIVAWVTLWHRVKDSRKKKKDDS